MIGVIGCGNMGGALLRGMLRAERFSPRQLIAWDSDPAKLAALVRTLGIRRARTNKEVAFAHAILLAVKPQQMEEVLREIRPSLEHKPILISIAAGIPIRWIEKRVGNKIPVIRVMPNTPALVGAGISALAKGRAATQKDLRFAQKVFGCVGETVRVSESLMDAITAVSGSGPAYFFYLMEQMILAGIQMGLSSETAQHLVVQTAVGAAQLALKTKEGPAILRARVTSKGGTTEAAFRQWKKQHLGDILQTGIRAAAKRAKELSRNPCLF